MVLHLDIDNLFDVNPLVGGDNSLIPNAPQDYYPRVGDIIVAQDKTGDTDTIQDAIKMLPKDGGRLFIKKGTYYIDGQLKIWGTNISFIGEGFDTKFEFINQTSARQIEIQGHSNIIFKDIRFYFQDTASAQTGMWIHDGDNIKIEGCFFENAQEEGLVISARDTATLMLFILGCKFNNNKYGLYIYNSSYISVINCTAVSNSHTGIYITGLNKGIVTNNTTHSNTIGQLYLASITDSEIAHNKTT